MQRLIFTVITSFFIMLAAGPVLIPVLKRLKVGQPIRGDGPETHKKKEGTLTMGGLLMWASIALCALAFCPAWANFTDALVLVGSMLAFGLIGFLDDYLKVVRHNPDGLAPRYKVIGQLVVSSALTAYCYFNPRIGPSLIVPFLGIEWNTGLLYFPLMIFAGVATTNSTNITDGVDGLLSGITVVVASVFALLGMFIAQAAGNTDFPLAGTPAMAMVFAGAVAGSCLGFQRYNAHPAKLIMGDTGSFALGGAVLGMAMFLRLPLLIPVVGLMYVASSLSVIVQRYYFKITHGKRIIRMSPLHHHFELGGASETQIVAGYVAVTILLGLLSLMAI